MLLGDQANGPLRGSRAAERVNYMVGAHHVMG